MALTPKQERFCEEYVVDLNATQAAIRAGYSKKTANRIGSENLSKLDIQERVHALKDRRSQKLEISANTVLTELLRIATCDIAAAFDADGNLKPIHEIPEDVRKVIGSVETLEEFAGRGEGRQRIGFTKKLKLWDKNKALDMLARHLGLFEKDNKQQGLTLTDIMAQVMAKHGHG